MWKVALRTGSALEVADTQHICLPCLCSLLELSRRLLEDPMIPKGSDVSCSERHFGSTSVGQEAGKVWGTQTRC